MLNAESGSPNHVIQPSVVAPEYAPDGRTLLSATFLGREERDDGALADETAQALDRWFPERQIDLEVLATDRIGFAQFAQPPGIHDDLPATTTPDAPVFLAGEFTSWSAIDGALESGRSAAAAVDRWARERSATASRATD